MSNLTPHEIYEAVALVIDSPELFSTVDSLNMTYNEVIDVMTANKYTAIITSLLNRKNTIEYLTHYGKVLTVASYQVFNPTTGAPTTCATKEEATALASQFASEYLTTHLPGIVEEIYNENGDKIWSSVPVTANASVSW